jgi:hypothetical protein
VVKKLFSGAGDKGAYGEADVASPPKTNRVGGAFWKKGLNMVLEE